MITVITGSMFSGKTNEFVRRVNSARAAGKRVKVFKPSMDTRTKNITSRDGCSLEADILEVDLFANDFLVIFKELFPVDIIAIDEVQFFYKEDLPRAVRLSDKMLPVDFIFSGLSRDFLGRGFGATPELLTMADEIVQTWAVCNKCKSLQATRTKRISQDKPTIVVGSSVYEARCSKCFYKD